MAIRFKRILRFSDPTDKSSVKRTYPIISYKYDTSATLKEVAQEISGNSGVSEGETISVLKDFRTLLRKTLLTGRSVNIDGIGYFYLSAQSKGTDKPEDFSASDITGLRICFRANRDIRINAGATQRSSIIWFARAESACTFTRSFRGVKLSDCARTGLTAVKGSRQRVINAIVLILY